MSKYGPKPRPVLDRFWEKVEKTDNCWNWTGAHTGAGYGNFYIGDKVLMGAHKFSYELVNGKVPEPLVLDHLCRNRGCVNPAHLEVVTERENFYRGTGWSGRNIRKRVCSRGHELTQNNLINRQGARKGRRDCKKCQIIRNHKHFNKVAK